MSDRWIGQVPTRVRLRYRPGEPIDVELWMLDDQGHPYDVEESGWEFAANFGGSEGAVTVVGHTVSVALADTTGLPDRAEWSLTRTEPSGPEMWLAGPLVATPWAGDPRQRFRVVYAPGRQAVLRLGARGLPGPRGDKGPDGDPGPKGLPGPQGEQGIWEAVTQEEYDALLDPDPAVLYCFVEDSS